MHSGHGSQYERDLFLDIDKGVLVATETIHNEGTPEKEFDENGEPPDFLKRLAN